MDDKYIREYRDLRRAGWLVEKSPAVRFNAGGESESVGHIVSKTLTAKCCLQNGYMVDTEVTSDRGHGEIDVLAYSPDRINYAVELETNPDGGVVNDKKARYVDSNDVIGEIVVIEVASLPAHTLDMRDRILTNLGFL